MLTLGNNGSTERAKVQYLGIFGFNLLSSTSTPASQSEAGGVGLNIRQSQTNVYHEEVPGIDQLDVPHEVLPGQEALHVHVKLLPQHKQLLQTAVQPGNITSIYLMEVRCAVYH